MTHTAEKACSSTQATFNRAANSAIAEASKVCATRGNEYSDSWSLNNLKTPALDNLLSAYSPREFVIGSDQYKMLRRLIVMASLIDVKISRLTGDWKRDTGLNLINYTAAYTTLREEFDATVHAPKSLPRDAFEGQREFQFMGTSQQIVNDSRSSPQSSVSR